MSFIAFIILIYFIVFLIGVIRGLPHYGFSAYGVGRNAGFYTLNAAMSYIYFKDNPSTCLKFFKYLAVLSALVSISLYVYFLATNHPEPHRAFGTLRTLIIAFYFLLKLFKMLSRYPLSKKHTSDYIWLAFLGCLILISSQRAIWVGIAVILVLYMFNLNFKRTFKITVFGIIPTLILVFLTYQRLPNDSVIKQNVTSRFVAIINPTEERSASTRIISWLVAYEDFKSNLVLGEGVGEREKIYYKVPGVEAREEYIMTHNFYLTVAEQRGLFGLIPLILLIVTLFILFLKNLKHSMKVDDSLIQIKQFILTLLVFTSIYRFFWNDQPVFWIVLGILLAINETVKKSLSVTSDKIHEGFTH